MKQLEVLLNVHIIFISFTTAAWVSVSCVGIPGGQPFNTPFSAGMSLVKASLRSVFESPTSRWGWQKGGSYPQR